MYIALAQLMLVIAVVLFIQYWHRLSRKKENLCWEHLLARLRASGWSAGALSDRYLWREGINATPYDVWDKIDGSRGLWAMYTNASVLVDMADYAMERIEGVDTVMVEGMRSDAIHIRMYVLMALAQYALMLSTAKVQVNTHRAAALYLGMMARMTQLLQEKAAALVPEFVEVA